MGLKISQFNILLLNHLNNKFSASKNPVIAATCRQPQLYQKGHSKNSTKNMCTMTIKKVTVY